MINPLRPIAAAEIKEQETKSSARNSGSAGGRTGSADESTSSPDVTVTISAANSEAAVITLRDYEAAAGMLRETTELIRQNPETAEFAQKGIPPYIVPGLT